MISALSGSGIATLTTSNDVVSQSYTANMVTPPGPSPVNYPTISGPSGTGGLVSTKTVAAGDVARIGYTNSCCAGEHAILDRHIYWYQIYCRRY